MEVLIYFGVLCSLIIPIIYLTRGNQFLYWILSIWIVCTGGWLYSYPFSYLLLMRIGLFSLGVLLFLFIGLFIKELLKDYYMWNVECMNCGFTFSAEYTKKGRDLVFEQMHKHMRHTIGETGVDIHYLNYPGESFVS